MGQRPSECVPGTWPGTGDRPFGEQLAQAAETATQSAGPGARTHSQGGAVQEGSVCGIRVGATPCPLFGGFASPTLGSPPAGSVRTHEPRGRAPGRRGRVHLFRNGGR